MKTSSAIVIGAGVVGLAMARALSQKGYRVKLFDRSSRAAGASVRSSGMVCPVGQQGRLYERAMRSRELWMEAGSAGAFWYEPAGSLHLAYHPDEWQVLQEWYAAYRNDRSVRLLSPHELGNMSEAVVENGLIGGLHSADELMVDPREAIAALPEWLTEKHEVRFYWNKCVSYITDNTVYIGNDEEYEADLILLCSGSDFETLYPEAFSKHPLTRCKQQLIRFQAQPDAWRTGPALCGGLSFLHQKSFSAAASLPALKERFGQELPAYLDSGIQVMVSQNGYGEIIAGASHEYGSGHDPFNKAFINNMIVDYCKTFAKLKDWRVSETWNCVYPQLTDGEADLFFSPEPGVYVVNGLGESAMTLAFGLAEEITRSL